MRIATRFTLLGCVLLFWSASALAQVGSELLLPFPPEQEFNLQSAALLLGESETDLPGEPGLDLTIYESFGRYEMPRLGYSLVHLDVDTDVGDFPDNLTDVAVAAGVYTSRWRGWTIGAVAGVGYAGTDPFDDANAFYGLATLAAVKEIDETTQLAVGLDYSGNRAAFPDVPLPGFAYVKQLDPELQLTLGLPVNAVRWQPTDALLVRGRYTVPDRFDLAVFYDLTKDWQLFLNTETRNEAFHVDGTVFGTDLESDNDRLLFSQRRVEAGVQWSPGEHLAFTAGVGYAFDQEFNTGWDFRDTDELFELSDETYVRGGFEVRF